VNQFDGPVAIAINQKTGVIYVCEQGNNRVQYFNAQGGWLGNFGSKGSGDGRFNAPDGIAVNSDTGQVYVSEFGGARVQRFDATGGYETQWGGSGDGDGQFSNPAGLAVDDSGRVFVADSGNDRVQIFDADGHFVAKFGSRGTGDGQFRSPWSVALGEKGFVYVADSGNNRVTRWKLTEPPVVTIAGKPKRATSLAALVIRGKVTRSPGSPAIRRVTVTVNKRGFKASGTMSWKCRVPLRFGRNIVTVVARDASGAKSDPVQVIVARRK
jgi:DNA-binding beta-propeller fold protein YncE